MTDKATPKPLTPKQARFVLEYLVDLNAAAAARRAGFADSVADSHASLWVGKSRDLCPEKWRHIWDAVQKEREERNAAVKVTAHDILRDLDEMRRADIADALDENGELKPFDQMSKGLRNLLTGFDVHEIMDEDSQRLASRTKKPRFTKKLDVLALLGKHVDVQAFKERIEHTHKMDLASQIAKGRGRAKVPQS